MLMKKVVDSERGRLEQKKHMSKESLYTHKLVKVIHEYTYYLYI